MFVLYNDCLILIFKLKKLEEFFVKSHITSHFTLFLKFKEIW